MTKHPCESCSMPIETGTYCEHCVDSTGALQPFDERFERMISWQAQAAVGDAPRARIRDAGLHGEDAGLA